MFNNFPAFGGGMNFGYSSNINGSNEFKENYRIYPISYLPNTVSDEKKQLLNNSGKIILPPSALTKLSFLEISYPMLFEIQSNISFNSTNVGVLEFISEEGRVYAPDWIIEQLKSPVTSTVTIKSISLPKANFVKLEPQSVDFLEIENPKVVLENCLRNYSCLKLDDIIQINYNNKFFKIKITDLKPDPKGSCIIETDLVTDFDPPKGYVEPDYKKEQEKIQKIEAIGEKDPTIESMTKRVYIPTLTNDNLLKPTAKGVKLNGKKVSNSQILDDKPIVTHEQLKKLTSETEIKPLILEDGVLFFGFPYIAPNNGDSKDDDDSKDQNNSANFVGKGQKLKRNNKRKIGKVSPTGVKGGLSQEEEGRKSPKT
ncbi:hypothetical protein ACO0SA_002539 [Hanseniaspora valbyensis]